MNRKLTHRLLFRLTTAFLLVALVGVLVVAIMTNRATTAGFRRYLDAGTSSSWAAIQSDLAAYYEQNGRWESAAALLSEAIGSNRGMGNTSLTLVDDRETEIATAGARRGQGPGAGQPVSETRLPIEVDGRTVGTLIVNSPGLGGSRAAEAYLAEVNRAIWLGGLAATLLALALGAWLAYRLTGPLRQLTLATHELAAGKLSHEIVIDDQGELGELAASFNSMTASLNQAEDQRRQLFADIAHELRTPLSVLRGQLEAMLDGVFPLTADNLAIAHEETLLLGRLVEDLRTLSLAEAGELTLTCRAVDPRAAAEQTVAAFRPLFEVEQVTLLADIAESLPEVWADAERLQQVLGNLLTNALVYGRQASGNNPTVHLAVAQAGDQIHFTIRDNGPGLSDEAQAHVFDRFWRADQSRNRTAGGSGLGLAISQAIVVAHGGRIGVESTAQQGTAFHFTLPVRS